MTAVASMLASGADPKALLSRHANAFGGRHAFCASENLLAFMRLHSSSSQGSVAENSSFKRSSFRGSDHAPLLPTLVATALLIALHSVLAALAPRSEFLSYIIKGRPVRLISNGVVDWEAAEKSRLGERDLTEQLRLKGLRGPDEVEVAYIERNGAISIVKAQKK
ncbi:YetF domain-containing protein [Thioclava sp. IC9]|uniref:DUF421 domain-containing protein n=1 Tax=Thioclava sp. IC9 TaxID=1973007 RepID=UPI000B53D048|nr:YetF domain-containing protein [Thioclava sp. IC9]OWY06851.1 hypothetical protein B6V76_03480 [Thioclava sp. IC9]